MIEISIQTVDYKGLARVIDPDLDPKQIAMGDLRKVTEEREILYSGPAVVIEPALNLTALAGLARTLAPSVMQRVFFAPTTGNTLTSTVVPLSSTEKSEGFGLVDQISLEALEGVTHLISSGNALYYLR